MSDPEKYTSHEAETETAMLRADLMNLIYANADKVAIRTLDDLEQPTNIVLAGTYQATSEVQTREKIKVWHRIFNNQNDYLVIMYEGSEVHWAHITDSEAHWVWNGRPQLSKDDVQKIQWRIQPDIAEWDMNAAAKAVSGDDVFDTLDYWV